MKLFSFNKSSNFQITQDDREWVEENFKWLIDVYGYPSTDYGQVLLNQESFPKSFRTDEPTIEDIFDDLCAMFLNDDERLKVRYELVKDIRDTLGAPYEIDGVPFECETEITKAQVKIYVANNLLSHPQRLIFSLIYEFVIIRLSLDKLGFDTGTDTDLFVYLAGVYFGFGVVLAQNLTHIGRSTDSLWETRWRFVAEIPEEIMAFSLALMVSLVGEDDPRWKKALAPNFRAKFKAAIAYLKKSPSHLYDKNELETHRFLAQADQEYLAGDYESAISTTQKVLFLTKDDFIKAEAFNNMGYYQLRLSDFDSAVVSLKKAISLNGNLGFAYDNLGYALIRTGNLEEGKTYLEQALQIGNNDPAYSHLNFAVYYQNSNETAKAEEHFKLSFETMTIPVDNLEFHYAEFLFAKGDREKALKYLQIAVDNGEPEAIRLLNEKS